MTKIFKMKLGEISNKRGEIAEKFIGIEGIIDEVISYHYFKKFNVDFVFKILKNENSNFGLKRSVFEEIIYDFKNKDEIIKGIHKLNRIRNIFAHSISIANNPDGDVFFENPKIGKERLNTETLYKEFMGQHKKTFNLMVSLGEKYGLKTDLRIPD